MQTAHLQDLYLYTMLITFTCQHHNEDFMVVSYTESGKRTMRELEDYTILRFFFALKTAAAHMTVKRLLFVIANYI